MHEHKQHQRSKAVKADLDHRSSSTDLDDADLHGGEAAGETKRTKERWDTVSNVPASDEGDDEAM